jgi:hypothetical protein
MILEGMGIARFSRSPPISVPNGFRNRGKGVSLRFIPSRMVLGFAVEGEYAF